MLFRKVFSWLVLKPHDARQPGLQGPFDRSAEPRRSQGLCPDASVPDRTHHSLFSSRIGSIRCARLAGRYDTAMVTAAVVIAAATMLMASYGATPNNRARRKRPPRIASAMPPS